MADNLIQTGQAADIYIGRLEFGRTQFYRVTSVTCSASFHQETSLLFYQQRTGGNPAATLIGIDDKDIAYFHLTGIQTAWTEVFNQFGCDPDGNWIQLGYGTLGRTINITDGGSSTAPYNGQPVIPHSGYPVAAARRRGPGQDTWVPFSAGDAALLTVASAAGACGVNDFYGNLGGAPEPINLVIRSIPVD